MTVTTLPEVQSTFVGGGAWFGWPWGLIFAAELPESVEKENAGEAEHDEDLKQAVDGLPRIGDKDPGYACKGNQAKHDGDQEHHGRQVASSGRKVVSDRFAAPQEKRIARFANGCG
jgi:hypothetical protein